MNGAALNTPNYTPTLAGIYSNLDELIAFIDKVRSGEPIVWTDTTTGESYTVTADENLAYIEDRLLYLASDVEDLGKHILHLTGRMTNETE